MGLKTFHIVFVTLSTLLAFVFAGWSYHAYRTVGGASYLALTVGSAIAGLALIVYGFWFWKKITAEEKKRREQRRKFHTVPLAALTCLLGTRVAPACSVCYGDAEGAMIDGARMGVWLLFGTIGLMQICFALFFVYLWRRARRHHRGQIQPWWVEQ